MPEERNFLDWEPILTPEQVYSDTLGFSFLLSSNDGIFYWVESRTSEKGRNTIVKLENGAITDLTPVSFNVRTRVHEYGGRPYFVGKNHIYFVNFLDQQIYKQSIKDPSDIRPLTPAKNKDESIGKYMDLTESIDETKLFFVYEQEFSDHSMPKNSIACLDLSIDTLQEPQILVEGNDFYSEFNLSTDGVFCCWLTWNLPNMPFDYTELWSAKITKSGLINRKKIAGGSGESISSPLFGPRNDIFFAMDYPNKKDDEFENYWNIYRFNQKSEKIHAITKEFVEFGQPLWLSGRINFRFITESEMVCLYRKNGKSNLALLNLTELKLKKLHLPYTVINEFLVVGQKIYLVSGSPILPKSIVSYNFINEELKDEKLIRKSLPEKSILPDNQIAQGKLISFPTKDGEKGYGYFYQPKNPNYESKEKPPLLILVHGGPTANSDTFYINYIQFWTSSGFAIFDIEHRGSTGFGRRYRDKLLGNWGLIEISDIDDAINFLVNKKVISKKIAITGGSAGGYTVQRALTSLPDVFQVGASYFGIGNLETLVQLTHKFESKYIDRLVGVDLTTLKERSPINHLNDLKAPMIIFQGSEDKIVPPKVSREMAQILKSKGIKSAYIEYPSESHGFRQLENRVDSLNKEASFFKEVLKSSK